MHRQSGLVPSPLYFSNRLLARTKKIRRADEREAEEFGEQSDRSGMLGDASSGLAGIENLFAG